MTGVKSAVIFSSIQQQLGLRWRTEMFFLKISTKSEFLEKIIFDGEMRDQPTGFGRKINLEIFSLKFKS